MLREFITRFRGPPLSDERREALRQSTPVNSAGFDPWGLNLDTAEETVRWARSLYEDYFEVETKGIENVPAGRVMLVPNHGGQLPLDGLVIGLAMVLEGNPPRVVRGMVERWFPSLPFVSTLFTRCGQVVGDPDNCTELLERDQCIMVFPEGVRGSGKTWWHRYKLQHFGTGFMRLALQSQVPIVPVAVIGAEETYPAVYNWRSLAKLVGAPYLPITPMMALGPLAAVPVRVKIQIEFGEPFYFGGDPDQSDEDVLDKVNQVRDRLQSMIDRGLEQRPDLQRLDRFQKIRGYLKKDG